MKMNRSQFRDIIREFLEGDVRPEEDQYAPREEQDRVCVYSSGSAKMAKQQLFDLARKAQSMHDQLLDDDELPEWVESKIAVMADNMSTVSDHLSYKMHRGEVGVVDEGNVYDEIFALDDGGLQADLDMSNIGEVDEIEEDDKLEVALEDSAEHVHESPNHKTSARMRIRHGSKEAE